MAWAGDSVEVPAAALPVVPSRTWTCNGREFKTLKAAAAAGHRCCCFVPLLNPTSRPAAIWLGFTNVVDLTYTAFCVALSLAFSNNLSFNGSLLAVLDLFGSIVYMVDLGMGFHLGVVARWQDRAIVVRDGRMAARFYMRHGTFWMDLIATLPLFAQIIVAVVGKEIPAVRLIYMLRLLRLVRVFRLLANLSRSSVGGPLQFVAAALTTRTLLLLHALFSLCLLVNLLGCIWWNVAVSEGLEHSWATAITMDFDLLTATNPQRWLVSCYFALTTMVTIGYGDITPVTIKEVGVTMLFQVVGVAFFGYLLNVVTSLITAVGPAAKRAEAVREKLEEVEDAMAQVNMSNALRHKIRHYYSTTWAPPQNYSLQSQLFSEMPLGLWERMVAQTQQPLLEELGFFPPAMLKREYKACSALIASASVPHILLPGQSLEAALPAAVEAAGDGGGSKEGGALEGTALSAGRFFFLLGEGRMSMAGSGVFTAPAILGLTELFAADSTLREALGAGGAPSWQQAGAVALTTCNLIRISCSQVYPLLRQHKPVLLQHLAGKLLGELQAAVAAAGVPPGKQQRGDSAAPSKALGQLVAELEAEIQAAAAAAGKGGVQAVTSLPTQPTSMDGSWEEEGSKGDLAGVGVSTAAPLGFVWHCD